MKRNVFVFLISIVLISPLAAENLIKNPGMELGGDNNAVSWSLSQYNKDGVSIKRSTHDPHGGAYSLVVTAEVKNDVRFFQTINVVSNTLYEVTAWVKAENVGEDTKGVNISLKDVQHTSQDIRGTSSWKKLSLYFKTAKDGNSVVISLSLGGYANTNTGTAYFDDIIMQKIDKAPKGAKVYKFQPLNADGPAGATYKKAIKVKLPFILMTTLIAMLILTALLLAIIFRKKKDNSLRLLKIEWLNRLPPFRTGDKGIKGYLFSPYIILFFPLLIIGFFFLVDLFNSFNTEPIRGFENMYIYQAEAILDGRMNISKYLHDAAIFEGKYYVIYPPFPVLLLLPFVALFGMGTEVTMISAAMTIIHIIFFYKLLVRVGIKRKNIPWITAAYIGGTAYWFCFSRAFGVPFFAHICAAFATVLALYEAFGKGRGILVGLYTGMAFLSRQLAIFYFIFFVVILYDRMKDKTMRAKIRNLILLCSGVGICVVIYFLYNYLRFGDIFDTGYSYLDLKGFMKDRVDAYGQFHPVYLPFNFIQTFLQGFHFEFKFPQMLEVVHIDRFGTSLTFASPFVFFALKAKWKKSYLIGAWASILIMLVMHLLYYNNGWVQYNTQRFSLDYMPLLMVLVALGIKNNISVKIWKPAILYSLALNALSLWIVLPEAAKKFF